MIKRRAILKGLSAGAALSVSGCFTRPAAARVVIVGGGFGGVMAARRVKSLEPALSVTLIEPKRAYIACPFSNLVISGHRTLADQTFDYARLVGEGIRLIPLRALGIDPISQRVDCGAGGKIDYDRLILAPGVSFRYEALEGYSEAVSEKMPHAWAAGEQTLRLRQQLEAMEDGGLVTIAIPDNPYRCPPGPYERASLIADYLKRNKPRSKVLLLDSKDRFSKQDLFQRAWREKYAGMLEWQGRSDGASVVRVDGDAMTLHTDFDSITADVANVIPPQQAGAIAVSSGIADESGWCPVKAKTFESTLANNVHVIGDAAILNAMPKSAFSANAQAKLCAIQVVRELKGLDPVDVPLANTCYSLIETGYGISVAGVYRANGERWDSVPNAGGTSPADAPLDVRSLEARYADDWFRAITQETFS